MDAEHHDRDDLPQGEEQPDTTQGDGAWRLLSRSMIFSLFAHLSPLLLTLSFAPSFEPIDLDTEWFGEFEELQAVGHGNAGRPVEFVVPPEEPEQEPEPPEEEPEEIPEEPEPEEEPPKEEPEPEPEPPEEKEEPPKLAAIEKTKPEPKKEPVEKEKPPEKEEPPKREEPVEKPPEKAPPARSAESLPGLEYSGPSNLPMLKNYAPGNARMTALIRFDVIRGTPYHDPTNKLMAAVPDYRIVLDGSTTDPVRDFDTIFAASANPMYLQETFLVVKHSLGKRAIERQLDSRFESAPEWGSYRGVKMRPIVPESSKYQDPRKVLISDDSTALVARTEWLKTLTADQAADSAIRPGFEGEEPPKFTMLQSFEHIANAAPGDTMLLASYQGLAFTLPGLKGAIRPETLRVSITTPKNPRVTADLQFKTEKEASSFAAKCPSMQRAIIGSIPGARFMKIDKYIERLECSAEDTYVTVSGTYTQKEFLRAINLATPFLPKPPSLEDLPRPPERAPKPTADMGTVAASPDAGAPDMGITDMSSPSAPDMSVDMSTKSAPAPTRDMGKKKSIPEAKPDQDMAPAGAPEGKKEPSPSILTPDMARAQQPD